MQNRPLHPVCARGRCVYCPGRGTRMCPWCPTNPAFTLAGAQFSPKQHFVQLSVQSNRNKIIRGDFLTGGHALQLYLLMGDAGFAGGTGGLARFSEGEPWGLGAISGGPGAGRSGAEVGGGGGGAVGGGFRALIFLCASAICNTTICLSRDILSKHIRYHAQEIRKRAYSGLRSFHRF